MKCRPARPGLHVLAKLHVHEAVGEGGGHGCGDSRVLHTVTRRADIPAVGDFVEIAQAAVKDQFVGGHLQGAVRRRQLVEEQDAAPLARPFAGDHPVYLLVFAVGDGESAHIHGFTLCEAHVDELDAYLVRDAADDGGLAEAWCPPDHQRGKDVRQLWMLRQRPELHSEDFLQLGGGDAVVHVNEGACFLGHII